MKKIAVCLNTHFLNDEVYNRFKALKENPSEGFDFYIICNNELLENKNLNIVNKDGYPIFFYSSKDLKNNGYILRETSLRYNNKSVMWVNGSLMPINLFHKIKPDYDYYWSIEYDIIFNGQWRYFFDKVHEIEYDFCTSHYEEASKEWWWYDDIYFPEEVKEMWPEDFKRYQSFNTICAFSNKFIEYLDTLYKLGYYGNCEQTLPTAAVNNKEMKAIDLSSIGLCTKESNNWKRTYINMDIENIIYHPVKI